MTTSATIWRRRAMLMAVVGLLLALPAVLLLRNGNEQPASAPEPPLPVLGPGIRDAGLGVRYQVPGGWRQHKRASAIQLRGPDRAVEIVIAAPAPAAEAPGVLDEAVAAVRAAYRDVHLRRGVRRRLGGVRTRGAVAAARTSSGTRLRILIAVARGERRAYLVEVFTAAGVGSERLREAQVALNSLRFLR